MLKTKLFRQHYFITALILVLFLALGIAMHFVVMRVLAPFPTMNPPILFAKLIDQIDRKDRIAALKQVVKLNHDSGPPISLSLIDEQGNVLYPANEHLSFDWKSIAPPRLAYEFVNAGREAQRGPIPRQVLIRLDGDPIQYLMVTIKPPGPPPTLGLIAALGSIVLSVLLGVGVALLALFRSLQKKAQLADSVIAELQRGNLKARFPIKRMDEIGQAMSKFNTMADEIERLVEQVKTAEKSRITLLQELAHDLRTPIASLKNLIDTLQGKDEKIAQSTREELLALAQSEINYFERLVEDLLTLAQVSEPHYRADRKSVKINELLDDEAETIAAQYGSTSKTIKLEKVIPDRSTEIVGDVQLLRRMIRNALTNAFSFANSKVTVSLGNEKADGRGFILMRIEDDGPGMSTDAIASFGERRQTRVLDNGKGGRVSVGLGSVIMKTVARIHRGEVAPSNRTGASGHIEGATIEILLPILDEVEQK